MLRRIFLYFTTISIFCHLQGDELSRSGFFTNGALLYWQAEEEGLSYAMISPSLNQLSRNAETKSPKFEWDFGFKVGMGYRIPHDRWELLIQFTSLQTHSDTDVYAGTDHVIFPVWQPPFSNPASFASVAKAHWRLHLGLIDFLIFKPISFTKTLALTPKIGIRWGSVRQKYNIEYGGGNFSLGEELLIRMKNKFWGIGPTAGLACDLAIANGFSLFGKADVSLLYGEFYLHQDADNQGSGEKLLGNHFIYRAPASVLEGSAGLRWQRSFKRAFKRLTLECAWDQMLLFSQNQLLRFVDDANPGVIVSNQGDLSIAGVQFSARFDF